MLCLWKYKFHIDEMRIRPMKGERVKVDLIIASEGNPVLRAKLMNI